ncbi:hypothetical protein ACFV1X_26545 [Streptomyces coelicoflavus]|uniref:hypothetical protein n=1 Tax=Streptomyces coelicoflavus TaxID=285562 RepID=UPI0036BB4B00
MLNLLDQAVEELELLRAADAMHDQETFLAGRNAPVFFDATIPNADVQLLLDAVVDLVPHPKPRPLVGGGTRPVDAPFAGLLFKVQTNMPPTTAAESPADRWAPVSSSVA